MRDPRVEEYTGALNAPGIVVTAGNNGESLVIRSMTEELTVAASATSTTTMKLPAGCIVLAVTVGVKAAITCTTNFTVGDAGSATRYSTAAVSKEINSTNLGTAAGAYYNATETGIVITPDTTPSDATGIVLITVFYIYVIPMTLTGEASRIRIMGM
jgi:hypothetical protein